MKRRRDPRRELARKLSGAKAGRSRRAVHAVRVGDAGERPPRLPVPPLRAAQYIMKPR